MRAAWRAARAAIRHRRLQTFVIGLVVLLSTTTIMVALALLDASSAPFDRAFGAQRGPHMVAAYDAARVTDAQLTGARTGVAAVAGPFGQVTLERTDSTGPSGGGPFGGGGPLTVVGRADPGGPVDRLDLWKGRWAAGLGEIVLNSPPQPDGLREPDSIMLGGRTFTVVGRAYSLSHSADGWVAPEQMTALRPTTSQMLYRFAGDVSTTAAVEARLAAVTAGLPADALLAAQSYRTVKDRIAAGPGTYVPLLATFGVLGLVVAVLIVGNVVSGAVVSGFRHIGVLKALGFTPRQVVAVYLGMVSVPAVVGCVLGAVLGDLITRPLLADAFAGLGLGGGIGASARVWVAALVGVPVLVLLAALTPALRAHRLSAAQAISAGSAPRAGRALGAQRRLSRTRLPRPVSLGLGLPLTRPGRTALTMAAVLLGVTTVTFASGLAATLADVAELSDRVSGDVIVQPHRAEARPSTSRSDAQIEALLRVQPGTARLVVVFGLPMSVVGQSEPLAVNFARGEVAELGFRDQLLAGRWMAAPNEVVASTQALRERGLAVGDRVTLERDGRRSTLTIVGQIMRDPPGARGLLADWRALAEVAPDRAVRSDQLLYVIQVDNGTDPAAYASAVRAADPGLLADGRGNEFEFQVIVVSFATVLALLLALVAALGVLNTVALNVHERRRDVGMLKSIGMTPRQVVTMVTISMAGIGAVGGLLGVALGIASHRLVMPLAAEAANIQLPVAVLRVWDAPLLLLLALSGVTIAVLGALLPARGAARLSIARVLHNE